jgi:hypothetical protein
MLNSSDVENWEMAREITANCEYDTSKPYLMHLYCSFSQLRKANGSANYQFLKKKLNKEVDLPNHYGRNGSPSFTAITKHLVTKFPTYNQIFLDLQVTDLNYCNLLFKYLFCSSFNEFKN